MSRKLLLLSASISNTLWRKIKDLNNNNINNNNNNNNRFSNSRHMDSSKKHQHQQVV